MTEKFILVSLEEEKAQKLADIISNKTCRRILDYLGENDEATEAKIAKELGIPISTVHYNIQLLLDNDMIESKEFKYSEKGREMDIFRVAKKLIVIAPKTTRGIKSRLRGIIPALLLSAGAAFAVQFVAQKFMPGQAIIETAAETAKRTFAAAPLEEAVIAAPQAAGEAATQAAAMPNYGLWFFAGALFAIAVYLIINLVRSRKKKVR